MAYIKNKYTATADPNVFQSVTGETFTKEQLQGFLQTLKSGEQTEQVKQYVKDLDTLVGSGYIELRKNEYPPITDYLDGIVKGDQAQIDAYIAACQAVKAKYPKPE